MKSYINILSFSIIIFVCFFGQNNIAYSYQTSQFIDTNKIAPQDNLSSIKTQNKALKDEIEALKENIKVLNNKENILVGKKRIKKPNDNYTKDSASNSLTAKNDIYNINYDVRNISSKSLNNNTADKSLPFISYTYKNKKVHLLTLNNAILYGMKHNHSLRYKLIARKLNYQSLTTAENTFKPKFSLSNIKANYYKSDYVSKSISIGPSVSWHLPEGATVGASAGYTMSDSQNELDWSISITQPLLKGFGFAVNESELKKAKYSQEEASDGLHKEIATTLLNIINDYYAVVGADNNLKTIQKTVEQSNKDLSVVKVKYKNGKVAKTAITESKISFFQKKQELVNAESQLENARDKLSEDINIPFGSPYVTDGNLSVDEFKPNLQKSIKQALTYNIKPSIRKIKIDKLDILSAKDQLKWSLDLTAGSGNDLSSLYGEKPSFNKHYNVGLSLTIPIGQTSEKLDLTNAELALQNDEYQLINFKLGVAQKVKSSLRNLSSMWENISLSKTQAALTNKNLIAAKIQFKYGKIDAYKLSQSQDQMIQAEKNIIKNMQSYLKEVYSFEEYTGTLLSSFNIHIKQ